MRLRTDNRLDRSDEGSRNFVVCWSVLETSYAADHGCNQHHSAGELLGQFRITLRSFRRLLKVQDVFPPYVNFVRAFGFKIDEDQKVWDGYHASISDGRKEGERNLRYGAQPGIAHQ